MSRMFVTLTLICLCLTSGRVSAQEEKNSSTERGAKIETIAGEWELKPLAVKGSPAGDTGGRFEYLDIFLDPPLWVQSGMVAFWAKFGPKDKDEALFTIKDGKVVRVLIEEQSFPALGSNKAQVQRTTNPYTPADSNLHLFVWETLHAGKNLLYINAVQGKWLPKLAIYTWDGERLQLLLAEDSEVELDGARYKVRSAFVREILPDGRAVIMCDMGRSKKGSRSKLDNFICYFFVHDGVMLTPLLQLEEEKPLPGLPDIIFQSFLHFSHFTGPLLFFNGGAVVALKVKGAPYKEALFRITAEKAEKIIAIGDPDPFDPTRKIQTILDGGATNKNNIAFVASSAKGSPKPMLLLYRDGKFQKVFDDTYPGVKEKAGLRYYEIGNGFFPEEGSSDFIFKVTFHRELSKSERDNLRANYELVPHYFFFDGEQAHHLYESAQTTLHSRLLPLAYLGKGPVETPGVIVRGVGAKGIRQLDTHITGGLPDRGSSWMIYGMGKDFSFKPALEFNVQGKKVSLGDVIGWKSPTEAIVRLDDGLYLLSRLRR